MSQGGREVKGGICHRGGRTLGKHLGIPSARRGWELTGELFFLKHDQLVGRGSQNQSSSYTINQVSNNTFCKQPGGEIPHIPGSPGWEILRLDFGVLLEEAELLQ